MFLVILCGLLCGLSYSLLFLLLVISALPDIVPDIDILRREMRINIIPLNRLRCPLEENCLSETAGYLIR